MIGIHDPLQTKEPWRPIHGAMRPRHFQMGDSTAIPRSALKRMQPAALVPSATIASQQFQVPGLKDFLSWDRLRSTKLNFIAAEQDDAGELGFRC